jgi:MFS transporter, CP family, cyanate transporter
VSRGRLALAGALFAAALALRPQLVGIGPLIPRIQSDLDLSHAVAGLLGTIPVLCMGLFAPPSRPLARRFGSRVAVAMALGLIAVFGVARGLVPGAAAVIILTIPIGIGMGLAGALLPVAVKERFPHRPAFATGVYATGISTGAAISAAIAAPLAAALSGWQGPLIVFSAFTAFLVPIWLRFMDDRPSVEAAPGIRSLPWASTLVWRLVAVFGLMSITYYGLNAWLPDSYVERGWSESSAGALLAVINVSSLPPTLIVPWLADRGRSRRTYLLGGGSALVVGVLGVVLVPSGAWAWAVVIGAAFGALFPLILTLPLDLADRPEHVGAVAAMMLGAGYTLSGTAPFVLGAVRDATGSFTTALWLLVAAASLLLALCIPLSPRRLQANVIAPAP